jgi:hypothetical protein
MDFRKGERQFCGLEFIPIAEEAGVKWNVSATVKSVGQSGAFISKSPGSFGECID